MTLPRFLAPMISAAALLPLAAHAQGTFFVPGTAGYNSDSPSGGGFTAPVAAGFYAGGTALNITASGTQDSNTSNHFFTDANGALTSPTNLFPYANVGSTNHPIVNVNNHRGKPLGFTSRPATQIIVAGLLLPASAPATGRNA